MVLLNVCFFFLGETYQWFSSMYVSFFLAKQDKYLTESSRELVYMGFCNVSV